MQRSRLGSLTAASAVALAAAIVSAPAAYAIPESTIKSECDDAGGEYSSSVLAGHRYSVCCYRDIDGDQYCDSYKDGTYTGTQAYQTGQPAPPPGLPAPPPSELAPPRQPVQPPTLPAPPPSELAPPQ